MYSSSSAVLLHCAVQSTGFCFCHLLRLCTCLCSTATAALCSIVSDHASNTNAAMVQCTPKHCAGSFLVVPCGQYKQTIDSPTLSTAYVYARGHWNQPFLRLPATNKVSIPTNLQQVLNMGILNRLRAARRIAQSQW